MIFCRGSGNVDIIKTCKMSCSGILSGPSFSPRKFQNELPREQNLDYSPTKACFRIPISVAFENCTFCIFSDPMRICHLTLARGQYGAGDAEAVGRLGAPPRHQGHLRCHGRPTRRGGEDWVRADTATDDSDGWKGIMKECVCRKGGHWR